MRKSPMKQTVAILLICTTMLIGCRRNLGQDIPSYSGTGNENAIVLPQAGSEQPVEGAAPAVEQVIVDPNTLDTTSGGEQPLASPGEGSAETQPVEEAVVETVVEAPVDPAPAPEEAVVEEAPAPAPTAEPAAPAPANVTNEQATVIHVVQQGDTIGRIAEQYGVSIDDILVSNGLFNENIISIGQELVVEAGAAANAPIQNNDQATGQQSFTQFDPNNYFIHTVGFGDTLFVLGQLYGFTVEELAAYNGIFDYNRIDLNQEIRIPNR